MTDLTNSYSNLKNIIKNSNYSEEDFLIIISNLLFDNIEQYQNLDVLFNNTEIIIDNKSNYDEFINKYDGQEDLISYHIIMAAHQLLYKANIIKNMKK